MTNADTKCREIAQVISEETAGAALPPGLQEHIRECSRCGQLVDASSMFPRVAAPSADLMSEVIESMRADLRPVRPLARASKYAALLAGVLLCAFGVATYSMAPYGWDEMGPFERISVLGALALGAVVCGRALVKQMIPAARYHVRPQLIPTLVVGVLAIGTAALFSFEREDAFWASSRICLEIGLGIAIPIAALVWLVLRKGIFLSPALTGATAGVLAGLVAAGALEVHCPNLNALHILASHLGITVCGGLLGLVIGRLAASRGRYRPLRAN
ncbi:MAG: NrsF family protein [Bryobacteraceae bacterium]